MVFVNSMSDLFHKDVPDSYIERVAEVMREADWHTYQVLTKRAERLCAFLQARPAFALAHIWWGVSVEDMKHGLPRMEMLRQTPAGLRMLSVEPLLEDLGEVNLDRIGWVIVGGESGRGARPMQASWVRSLRDQCEAAQVPFFFKQWGGVHKSKTGRVLDGRTHDETPARRTRDMPPRKVRLDMAASHVSSRRTRMEMVHLPRDSGEMAVYDSTAARRSRTLQGAPDRTDD